MPCSPAAVSLEEKIGQMLMVGFRGLVVDKDHPIVRDIVDRHIGGVVLFDYDVPSKSPVRNIESVSQLKSLVSSLQSFAKRSLLIAIDHEGGRVTRLKEKFGFPQTYSAQSLGQKDDPDFTFRQAESMARELRKLGINLNLAPVVDLNTNPANPIIGGLERSFSDSPDVVSRHVEKFIQAHHKNKVLCTLKHYPGHGSSADDSHLGLVDISDSWTEAELQPYRYLIEKGLADAVMTAHVFNKHLDPTFPATLSKRVIHDLLRKKLGFEGVIFSDDLQMGAIANEFGLETAIFRTLDAGIDILAFANNSTFDPQIAAKAFKIVKELVKTGKIHESRIDESWQRITKLKARWTDS
jgi:beta-N-acetylhexosaminidase